MYFLYSLLLTIGLIAASPVLLYDAFRKGKYIKGLRQRLGEIPEISSDNRAVIWLHCVSVGEATAARTLVDALSKQFASHRLVISTTTITGQAVAQELFADRAAAIFYFPIDWAWTVRRVLRQINPAAVLIMETELWPRLFHECHVRAIPVCLLNGRISNRSFRRYQLVGSFIRRVLNDLSLALMQSDEDAERVKQLGILEARVRVLGNLKFDTAETAPNPDVSQALDQRFRFAESSPLIIAASTHEPEESIVIDAFKLAKAEQSARLLIAPRHPERFSRVATLLAESGLKYARRSGEALPADADAEVILLDSVGELSAAYALAEIAFVGGSIAPHGGHNVLEPAALAVCVVTGPHTENFAAITNALLEAGALVQLPPAETTDAAAKLGGVLIELLRDQGKRREIGSKAQTVCRRNTGATERTVEAIAGLLNQASLRTAPAVSSLPASAFK